MQCKVSNRLTPMVLCRMITDAKEVVEYTEAVEEVEEDLAEVEDR